MDCLVKIDARNYGKNTSGGAIRVNIRLRPTKPHRITREEAEEAFDHLATHGEVPRGYEVAFIDWKHPTKATAQWRRGNVSDLEGFGAVLAMSTRGRNGASGLRIAVVKSTERPKASEDDEESEDE